MRSSPSSSRWLQLSEHGGAEGAWETPTSSRVESAALEKKIEARARERRHESRRRRSSRTSARTSRATPPASSASRRGWRVRSAASVGAAFMITAPRHRRDAVVVILRESTRLAWVAAMASARRHAAATPPTRPRVRVTERTRTPSTRRVRHRSRPSQITRSSGIRKTRT